jgi:hypothetical protein
MKYESGAAFRRALEDRLRNQSLQSGAPLIRLRKMAAFDRLLGRLLRDQPEGWMLKGGLALQLRLGERSRTTQDIDLLLVDRPPSIHQTLIQASLLDLGDWFQFEVAKQITSLANTAGGVRFLVQALIDGRPFERFHVDVGLDDPVIDPAEWIATPALLEFADIPPTLVACYPLTQQIAEKVHAYTRPRLRGESTRVKDLVDILLIAELSRLPGERLRRALQATFDARGVHPLPDRLPDPPANWVPSFRRMAKDLRLGYPELAEASRAAQRFLNPILQSQILTIWDPVAWEWR